MDSSIGEEGEKINAGSDQQGAADSHEEGVRTRECGESKSEDKRVPERDDLFSDQEPQITWRINEIPNQEKIERFLKEILELTGEGKMLLRARNKSPEPIFYEYLIQDALDVLTLSQVLMQLPTP